MNLKKYTLLVMALLFPLLIVEVMFRILPDFRERYSLNRWKTASNKDNTYELREHHRPSKYLGYEPAPNSGPQINSLGMFDREYSLDKKDGVFRIIFIGDSITAHSSYTELLEVRLEVRLDNIEVWNCAVGGYQMKQYLNYLKYKAADYDPDLVVIAFCLNDLDECIPVIYRDGDGLVSYYCPALPSRNIFIKYAFKYSYLARYLMLNLVKNLNNSRDLDVMVRENIKELKTTAKSMDSRLMAVVFPYVKLYEDYDQETKNYYNVLTDALTTESLDYIDLREDLEPYFKRNGTDIYRKFPGTEDYIHFSAEGDRLIEELLENRFLERIKRYRKTAF